MRQCNGQEETREDAPFATVRFAPVKQSDERKQPRGVDKDQSTIKNPKSCIFYGSIACLRAGEGKVGGLLALALVDGEISRWRGKDEY